ncbi:MAG: DUF1775 domain-containing protein [Gemmatimonadota bacterium]
MRQSTDRLTTRRAPRPLRKVRPLRAVRTLRAVRALRVPLAVGAVLAFAGALWAHAVVVPGESRTGAYETYTLRVPNEKDVPTTRIEITFPSEVFVISFAEVPGWTLEVTRDDTGRAVGATWTGVLPPHRFVELPFVGVNPTEPAVLVWSVDQTYAGPSGEEVVSWAGPADSEFPASRTTVVSAEEPAAADDRTSADGPANEGEPAAAEDPGGMAVRDVLAPVAVVLAGLALVVSALALVVTMRTRRRG